jgi:hypothetical protein
MPLPEVAEISAAPILPALRRCAAPPQIDRIKLNSSNVEKLPGYLCNDLRLGHAARVRDVQRNTFGNERMERLNEFRRFLGCPLWSDWSGEAEMETAMRTAGESANS